MKTSKTVAIVEARMRSSRLPGKVLLPILKRPLLELMIERLRRVSWIDEVLIATSSDPSCQPIEALARRLQTGCFRGSEEDVLGRVLGAAQSADADLIVETTGDCPLIDPQVVARVIEAFKSHPVDYCSNTLERTFPRGMDVQVFPVSVLEETARLTNNPVDREHVSLYIYEHPERFRLLNVESGLPPEMAQVRLTVDTFEDLDLVRSIYEALYPVKPAFSLQDILELLAHKPDLKKINAAVLQKPIR